MLCSKNQEYLKNTIAAFILEMKAIIKNLKDMFLVKFSMFLASHIYHFMIKMVRFMELRVSHVMAMISIGGYVGRKMLDIIYKHQHPAVKHFSRALTYEFCGP